MLPQELLQGGLEFFLLSMDSGADMGGKQAMPQRAQRAGKSKDRYAAGPIMQELRRSGQRNGM